MTTKANYLRKAAEEILKPDNGYNWEYPSVCNCGWVVRAIDPTIKNELFINVISYYSCHVQNCDVTGLTNVEVVNILLKAGFTPAEVIEIEDMENRKEFCNNTIEINKQNAVNHLLSIANRLELTTKVKTCQVQTVSVGC